jgi:hypothetical protein
VLVDRRGTQLAVSPTGGNRQDVTRLVPLLDAVTRIRGLRSRPRNKPKRPYADRGYDYDKYRCLLLNTHVSRAMRELIDARLWLTAYQLPPYAPEFNPVEGRVVAPVLGQPHRTRPRPAHPLAKSRLKRMQNRPGLIDGLVAKTGLYLQPL